MTGAMYAAISGLKSHMQKLNVIGNNVANVNTYGYKAARTTFKESLYTTVYSGSNGTTSIGGVNPSQIGYGCSVGTIDLDMSTANYTPTGVDLDCMIDGDGFFMVGSKPNTNVEDSGTTLDVTAAKDLYLTRVGNFKFDSQGYLVDGAGNVVYGFATIADAKTAPGIVDPNNNNPEYSTQLVPIRLPLAAKAGLTGTKEGTAIYPGLSADGDAGQMNIYDAAGENGQSTGKVISVDSVSIDGATGKVTAVNKETDEIVVVGYIALANVSNPAGVSHVQGPYFRAMEGAGDCVAASIGGAVKGNLNNRTTGDDQNPLIPVQSTGTTALITGGLESSGTDLATEISEMITTQRGYQANTRIITVTDSMLEELVNMKR